MFNSFVRAVSGLNPFGKAAEATNDVVIVPVGGIDEATLNNDGKPQQAPLERERRQVREMRPNKRDLVAGEIYYEAVNYGYQRPRPGDADVRNGGAMPDRDSQPVQGQFRERQEPRWWHYVPSPIGPTAIGWGSPVYPRHYNSQMSPSNFAPLEMTYGMYPGDMVQPLGLSRASNVSRYGWK